MLCTYCFIQFRKMYKTKKKTAQKRHISITTDDIKFCIKKTDAVKTK